uniref:Fibronectin type-III domain-containing protein n=1 Tax=Amphimedon queenslandica TaxID=400682 RepID=A0A1X7SQ21_AMPQE
MATTGVYWCLVLTECLSLVVSIVVQYSQTVPSPGVTPCPGDRIVLTCTTDTDTVPGGILLWANDDGGINQIINITQPTKGGSLSIEVTAVDGNMITSTATIESVPASLNGTMIGCAGLDIVFTYVTINVTGPPKLPVSYTTMPINDSALVINWAETEQCISNYTITITTNSTLTENNTVNTSSATFDNLIIGTNYSFIIIPIDTIGREGPPSSLIQYIWNVPAQVVNISWYQISTDSITIWWNSIEDTTLHPPIEYYIINVYITTICINSCSVYSYNVTDTNTTITGLSPINEYYTVTIIPVNVIGYGPSVTVNVSITTTTSSITNIMMSTTEYIIMQDKSSAMTALPTITETQLITTTETISSCTDSCSLCLTTTMSQSTDVGFISG